MKKRLTDREKLLARIEYLSDSQVKEILTILTTMEQKRQERMQNDPTEDDLLSFLSSAVENRRARQVFEWESVRRKTEARRAVR